MSTISQFNTKTVHASHNAQRDTFAEVKFPRPFVAPPRLPHGICELDVSHSSNIRAKATIEDITNTSGVYHITSWADTTLHGGVMNSLNLAPANLEFLTGEHFRCSNPGANYSKRIIFERPFLTPPKVVVFFNYIDLDKNHNWRLRITATHIDTNGFTLHIDTWGDTILHAAQACWIAYPEDRTYIFSTSVSTAEVRPWNRPDLQQSTSIQLPFGDVKFWKNPNVFVAFNRFDIGCGHNFRLKAYVDNVSLHELTWHIDSWGDTILYGADATIIAVN